MKSQSTYTVNDDAEYIEACRVQDELGKKSRVVAAEIAKEEAALVSDVMPERNPDALISNAIEFEPGVWEEKRKASVTRLGVLRGQLEQLHRASAAQADKVYAIRRDAGYRVFAKDNGGYIATAEKLLAAVDVVIALNDELQTRYTALCARGCDHLQHVLYPNPVTADNVPRDRANLADSIDILKQTAKNHAPR
jgi:hypothetical protein